MVAVGQVDGDSVIVADEKQANKLHAKGAVGTHGSGGHLRLSWIEAAYAVHAGRLRLPATQWTDLIAGRESAYLAYADLRDRGLVIRHDGEGFLVWNRGEAAPATPWFHLKTATERDAVVGHQMMQWAQQDVVIGVVDDDGVITYYQCKPSVPEGQIGWPKGHAKGTVLNDRVVVQGGFDSGHALGAMHGDDLLLSLTEAEALRRRGALDVDLSNVSAQHHFERTLPVFQALRDAGVVAKSGFRFGTHLRGYSQHPDETHAQWLIQCVHDDDVMHWSELSRAVRLAHGVRKEFLLALTAPVKFAHLSWFRP